MPATIHPEYDGRINPDGRGLSISAPAKINLFLRVLRKRQDGYHDILSWLQAIDLNDHLDLTLIPESSEIAITTDHPDLPTDSSNLIFKAARLIQEIAGRPVGFKVFLEKKIPVAAGLGGGSSDAAAFIKGANRLLNLGLDRSEKERLGLEIGSDVPFFFGRGQSEIRGRGEIVRDMVFPLDYVVILVTPPFGISAAEAYRKINLDLTGSITDVTLNCCRQAEELFGVISDLANDLERALRRSYPILERIRSELAGKGADIVRLSGSGPTVFALYRHKGLYSEKLVQSFMREGCRVVVTKPVILPVDD